MADQSVQRKKNGNPICKSRQIYGCPVPDCNVRKRRDKLKSEHFNILVGFDDKGVPLIPGTIRFNELDQNKKIHTRYFFENNLKRTSPADEIFKCSENSDKPLLKLNFFKKHKIDQGKRKISEDLDAADFESLCEPMQKADTGYALDDKINEENKDVLKLKEGQILVSLKNKARH